MAQPQLFGALAFTIIVLIQSSFVHGKEYDYQQKALGLHTKFRNIHRAPALVASNTLNALAQRCADYYTGRGKIDYSCPFIDRKLANENLFTSTNIFGDNWKLEKFTEDAITAWFGEVSAYNFDNQVSTPQNREFTQLVWVNSQKLGFVIVRNGNSAVAVALYSLPGNIQGQFKQNVLRINGR